MPPKRPFIVEIVRRSEQGVTRPFLCRSADGDTYFVKGTGVGIEALRAEWICGQLAAAVNLPIAPFSIVEVPQAIVALSAVEGVGELLGGAAFGSVLIRNAQEISFSMAQSVPVDLQAKILLFDWWTRHEDRKLTAWGGNPNLLVVGRGAAEVWLIDHHSSFDREFNEESFWNTHVFAKARAVWTSEWRRAAVEDLRRGAEALEQVWSQMPLEWYPEKDPSSPASELEYQRIAGILTGPVIAPSDFWKIP